MKAEKLKELQVLGAEIRIATLQAINAVGAGHVGGSMSMADLMALLYGHIMKVDPQNPRWEERDWLVVSKGHCGPAVYGALAKKGYFPEEELLTLNQGGTRLPSHCDRNLTPGIDMSTGSLGQGMSTALGIAWGHRYQKKKNWTYLVLGDGELAEGQIWEGALFANQQRLDNLIAFVDCNKKQLDGYTDEVCELGDLRKKFAEFGWDARECDGHDIEAMEQCIKDAKGTEHKPHMIILHTKKGKDCSFAEDIYYNHHLKFNEEEYETAVKNLRQQICQYKIKEV